MPGSTNTDVPLLDNLVQQIFFPDDMSRLNDLVRSNSRLVHYTSAEVAMSIIQNKAVWMRNSQTMNDFSEVEHGLACVHGAWTSEDVGIRFRSAIDAIHPGISASVADLFDSWQADMRRNTYLTCVSEHPPSENEYGRLSMWRAYGGRSGVALVMNLGPFAAQTDELKAYSSPVFYGTADDFRRRVDGVASLLEQYVDVLRAGLTPTDLTNNLFASLRFAALCTKHPAFSEEREWRVIYSPNMDPSPLIKPAVRVVRGIPQIVQMIPLIDDPEHGLWGADIPTFIDRIIIGPTEDVGAVFDAFRILLAEAGVEKPEEKISVSGIPLRQF